MTLVNLPLELLEVCFKIATDGEDGVSPVRLSHVSRRLRHVALGIPGYWMGIAFDRSHTYTLL